MENKISVVIPAVDQHMFTNATIDALYANAFDPNAIEVLLVDNDSAQAYNNRAGVKVIRNNINPGVYLSYTQGMEQANNNIVLWMHNDVMIHEFGWEQRILTEFNQDNKLGIAGFFGGRSVGPDGGRGHPEGNLIGQVWGQNIRDHGHLLTDKHPAVVFDSLAMIINRTIFNALNVPYVAPHHWFDRIMTLWFVSHGYHALTIGVGFDHYGGATSVGQNNRHSEFVQRWCESKGLSMDQNWDYTLYKYGSDFFRNTWGNRLPVTVNADYSLVWRQGRDFSDA